MSNSVSITVAVSILITIAVANVASFADYVAQAALQSCPAEIMECRK